MKRKVNIKTVPGMKASLAAKKPFIMAIILYDSFMTRTVMRTGEMMMPQRGEEIQGGHAVVAVGYDDSKQAFLVRNSWGKEWGQGGYFWMPYEYFKPTYIGASRFYGSCWTLE
jgi:C1A family cysteine protease